MAANEVKWRSATVHRYPVVTADPIAVSGAYPARSLGGYAMMRESNSRYADRMARLSNSNEARKAQERLAARIAAAERAELYNTNRTPIPPKKQAAPAPAPRVPTFKTYYQPRDLDALRPKPPQPEEVVRSVRSAERLI